MLNNNKKILKYNLDKQLLNRTYKSNEIIRVELSNGILVQITHNSISSQMQIIWSSDTSTDWLHLDRNYLNLIDGLRQNRITQQEILLLTEWCKHILSCQWTMIA